MNVCVDKAGQNGGIPKIDNFSFWRDLIERYYLADHFSFHEHASRTNSLSGYDAPGKEGLQIHVSGEAPCSLLSV
jgi:hypothetical protein